MDQSGKPAIRSMAMIRRKFSKEQKLEIVKESLEESVVMEELASRYKIHANSIYKWRRAYLHHQESAFPGQGNVSQSEEQKEIASLKKQLRESSRRRATWPMP